MENKNKLTIQELRKEEQKLNKVLSVKILNRYYVNVRPYVSHEDTSKIFTEFGTWLKDKKVISAIGDKILINYLMGFLIKTNTDIFEDKEYDNLELFGIINSLIELNAIDELLSSFDKNSLGLLYTKYDEIIKVSKKIDDIEKKMNKNDKNIKHSEGTRE